jgi:acetolactate synthase-1/2/3 large subunit
MLESLTALLPFIEGKTHESWHNKFKELYEIELEAVINEVKPKKEGISMGETIEMINKGDAIMVSDVGQHQMFTCRYKFNSSKVMLLLELGTMGFALPAAIGAKMGIQGSGCSYR